MYENILKELAQKSTIKTKCGAIIEHRGKIISTGHNHYDSRYGYSLNSYIL